jgi:hypothetical protein
MTPAQTDVERVALLPCPFCGGKAEIEQYGDKRRSTIIACTECACRLENGETFRHGTIWNTRAAMQPSVADAAMRDQLIAILDRDRKWPDAEETADAILAALPAMIAPLEWQETKHTNPDQLGIRGSKSGTCYCIIAAPNGGRCVLSSHGEASIGPHYFDNIDEAKSAADAHNRATLMAAIGMGVK